MACVKQLHGTHQTSTLAAMQHTQLISIAPDVAQALAAQQPVVALESTVIAHGLPYPQNNEVAHALEATVRAAGATPATVGVLAGVPTVGLDTAAIERFATSDDVLKLSRRDLALAVAQRRDGATTVAATMALAHLAGIAVFATGGIGGVHRGARDTWDVSGDLTELSRTPVLVVCAGAKAILDLPATLEVLETLGVPVVGYGTDELPAFYCRTSGLRLTARADTPEQVAALWQAHQHYGGGSGMLLTVPPPEQDALPVDEVEAAISSALAEAERSHVRGADVTPFLLSAMERATGGRSLQTNVALLKNNARMAAEVAVSIAASPRP
jgi:pseudouridine-5'-phosphate glycosidase